ncbi:DNA alkylation repair protein [Saccharospirillum alexandrii]|uniref:DNA alkylation repair protein n=1 Tax=Saccharospirillum alexandrii TaxID=2448477 RepID=UPI000FD982B1|nr:DNA alkylation repair protein [Saccharospirillum alexandrii]
MSDTVVCWSDVLIRLNTCTYVKAFYMDTQSIADEITQSLKALGRGTRQEHRPSSQHDFGVYTPELRGVVRDYKRRLASQSAEDVYQIALNLLDKNVTECRQAGYELVAGHKGARELLTPKRIEALGQDIDNWACVDGFCCTLVGRAWREGRVSDATVMRWSQSQDVWWRRAAVVATVPLNIKAHGGVGDTVRTLMVCQSLLNDEEIMVQKAISWALRSLVTWDRGSVQGFLEEQSGSVSALVRREVVHKLRTGKKN